MEQNPPPNYFGKDYNFDSGLNKIEPSVIKKLQDGQWFGHTGVFDFFDYSDECPIPFTLRGQKDKFTLCDELTAECEMVFTFPKCKDKAPLVLGAPYKDRVWRYQIQTVEKGTSKRSVVTSYGYFKMNNVCPTQLDLSNYAIEDVCWIRFTAFNSDNPMKRAWFPALRGPAFAKSADTIVDIADILPKMRERVMHTIPTEDEASNLLKVKEGQECTPTVVATSTLNLLFKKCSHSEQDDIYAYFFQGYPVKQPVGEDCHIRHSKRDPNDPSKAFAPRILESPHGYFQLCDEYPTRINMTKSWDETEVINKQVSVYSINAKTGQPKGIQHLVLDVFPEICYPVQPAAEIAPR